MLYRCMCLLGSVSLAEGFHVNVRTLPKLAELPVGATAASDTSHVSPVSTRGEELDGHEDLLDWNKQVNSESNPVTRASRRSHDRLMGGELSHVDPLSCCIFPNTQCKR